MNLKSALAVALCASAVFYAAGCLSSSSSKNEGGAALSFQGSGGGGAQANARPAASPTEENVQSPLPTPYGMVNDFARVIGDEAETEFEAKLTRLKESARIEVAVATVETTGGQDISDYSLAMARGWGIGPKSGEGGGILLLIVIKDRKWRIQVSRSLEADLPNDVTAEIGQRMTPHLRQSDYERAVRTCMEGLVKHLAARRGFKADDILITKN